MNQKTISFKKAIVDDLLAKHNADALLFYSFDNRLWYSGFSATEGYIVITKKQSYYFIDGRYYEKAKESIKHLDVVLTTNLEPIKALKINKLLVEGNYITLNDLEWISEISKSYEKFDAVDIRKIKTEEEISIMQKAADIAVCAIDYAKSILKVGITEKQLANAITSYMLDQGASGNSFSIIIAFGENSAVPHHHPTDRKLKESEFIKMDIGCVYNGYCSDITRTTWLGKPTTQMQEIYDLVLQANLAGIAAAKAGITGKALDAVCRKVISSNPKYANCFIHGTGHGLGIQIHELPNVKPIYNLPIEENAVITIEPGIYVPGFGGVRIEDSLVVKKDKPIILTKAAIK